MIKSKIFDEKNLVSFQNEILNFLNKSKEFSKHDAKSPRAVGDIVQEIVGEKLESFFPSDTKIKGCKYDYPRRAMQDMSFYDEDNNYFVVDIKTHNKDTKFNMPNLISVARLSKFYENDNSIFMILLVEYNVVNEKIKFDRIVFVPIENLNWNCLTIGALGKGQIQIANSNVVNMCKISRKEWMLTLCEKLETFYSKEIEKNRTRLQGITNIKKQWQIKKT